MTYRRYIPDHHHRGKHRCPGRAGVGEVVFRGVEYLTYCGGDMKGRQLSFLPWKLLGVILLSLSIDPAANLAGSHEINFPSRSATRERGTDQLNSGEQGCSAGNIDVSWAIENPPLEIERHTLRVTATGTSDTDFYARNLESSPIQALTLVSEYTDAHGGGIERLHAHDHASQAKE